MIAASNPLPDDKDALKAALIEARAKLSGAEAMISHLQLVIAKMKREMFGPRSERSQRLIDQMELQLEDLAAGLGEDAARLEAASGEVRSFARRKATRRDFPDELPRHEALEDRGGCHRNPRCRPAAMVRDRARAREVQLPVVRDDHAAACALPCDRARLRRWLGASPHGDWRPRW